MLYNKRHARKTGVRKVLHKIGKFWVTVSIAFLSLIGAKTMAAQVSANASNTLNNNENNANHQISNHSIGSAKSTLVHSNGSRLTSTSSSASVDQSSQATSAQSSSSQSASQSSVSQSSDSDALNFSGSEMTVSSVSMPSITPGSSDLHAFSSEVMSLQTKIISGISDRNLTHINHNSVQSGSMMSSDPASSNHTGSMPNASFNKLSVRQLKASANSLMTNVVNSAQSVKSNALDENAVAQQPAEMMETDAPEVGADTSVDNGSSSILDVNHLMDIVNNNVHGNTAATNDVTQLVNDLKITNGKFGNAVNPNDKVALGDLNNYLATVTTDLSNLGRDANVTDSKFNNGVSDLKNVNNGLSQALSGLNIMSSAMGPFLTARHPKIGIIANDVQNLGMKFNFNDLINDLNGNNSTFNELINTASSINTDNLGHTVQETFSPIRRQSSRIVKVLNCLNRIVNDPNATVQYNKALTDVSQLPNENGYAQSVTLNDLGNQVKTLAGNESLQLPAKANALGDDLRARAVGVQSNDINSINDELNGYSVGSLFDGVINNATTRNNYGKLNQIASEAKDDFSSAANAADFIYCLVPQLAGFTGANAASIKNDLNMIKNSAGTSDAYDLAKADANVANSVLNDLAGMNASNAASNLTDIHNDISNDSAFTSINALNSVAASAATEAASVSNHQSASASQAYGNFINNDLAGLFSNVVDSINKPGFHHSDFSTLVSNAENDLSLANASDFISKLATQDGNFNGATATDVKNALGSLANNPELNRTYQFMSNNASATKDVLNDLSGMNSDNEYSELSDIAGIAHSHFSNPTMFGPLADDVSNMAASTPHYGDNDFNTMLSNVLDLDLKNVADRLASDGANSTKKTAINNIVNAMMSLPNDWSKLSDIKSNVDTAFSGVRAPIDNVIDQILAHDGSDRDLANYANHLSDHDLGNAINDLNQGLIDVKSGQNNADYRTVLNDVKDIANNPKNEDRDLKAVAKVIQNGDLKNVPLLNSLAKTARHVANVENKARKNANAPKHAADNAAHQNHLDRQKRMAGLAKLRSWAANANTDAHNDSAAANGYAASATNSANAVQNEKSGLSSGADSSKAASYAAAAASEANNARSDSVNAANDSSNAATALNSANSANNLKLVASYARDAINDARDANVQMNNAKAASQAADTAISNANQAANAAKNSVTPNVTIIGQLLPGILNQITSKGYQAGNFDGTIEAIKSNLNRNSLSDLWSAIGNNQNVNDFLKDYGLTSEQVAGLLNDSNSVYKQLNAAYAQVHNDPKLGTILDDFEKVANGQQLIKNLSSIKQILLNDNNMKINGVQEIVAALNHKEQQLHQKHVDHHGKKASNDAARHNGTTPADIAHRAKANAEKVHEQHAKARADAEKKSADDAAARAAAQNKSSADSVARKAAANKSAADSAARSVASAKQAADAAKRSGMINNLRNRADNDAVRANAANESAQKSAASASASADDVKSDNSGLNSGSASDQASQDVAKAAASANVAKQDANSAASYANAAASDDAKAHSDTNLKSIANDVQSADQAARSASAASNAAAAASSEAAADVSDAATEASKAGKSSASNDSASLASYRNAASSAADAAGSTYHSAFDSAAEASDVANGVQADRSGLNSGVESTLASLDASKAASDAANASAAQSDASNQANVASVYANAAKNTTNVASASADAANAELAETKAQADATNASSALNSAKSDAANASVAASYAGKSANSSSSDNVNVFAQEINLDRNVIARDNSEMMANLDNPAVVMDPQAVSRANYDREQMNQIMSKFANDAASPNGFTAGDANHLAMSAGSIVNDSAQLLNEAKASAASSASNKNRPASNASSGHSASSSNGSLPNSNSNNVPSSHRASSAGTNNHPSSNVPNGSGQNPEGSSETSGSAGTDSAPASENSEASAGTPAQAPTKSTATTANVGTSSKLPQTGETSSNDSIGELVLMISALVSSLGVEIDRRRHLNQ